jgi:hypothetical protein
MSTTVIPEPIAQLQRQLDQFRSTQPRGRRLPDSMWQAAVELAREHGVYSVAHPLRLDDTGPKKRLGGVSHRRKARKPAFVELIAPPSAMLRECLIEFESGCATQKPLTAEKSSRTLRQGLQILFPRYTLGVSYTSFRRVLFWASVSCATDDSSSVVGGHHPCKTRSVTFATNP